jgi:hypothetical protein
MPRINAVQPMPFSTQYLKPRFFLDALEEYEFFVKFLVLQDNRSSVYALYEHVRSEWILDKSLLPRNITLLLWIGRHK